MRLGRLAPDFAKMSDLELLDIIETWGQDGNDVQAAEAELFRRYAGKILIHIRSMARNMPLDLHQDIFSEVMLSLILNLRKGRFDREKGDSLHGYIIGIVRRTIPGFQNRMIQRQVRRRSYQRELLAQESEMFEFEYMATLEENARQFEERVKQLQLALRDLKPRHREAIELRYLENKRMKEIGARLGVSEQQAIDLCRYALTMLKTFFTRNGGSGKNGL